MILSLLAIWFSYAYAGLPSSYANLDVFPCPPDVIPMPIPSPCPPDIIFN